MTSNGFSCRVERHSMSPAGAELLTVVVRFPRVVLAEVITHRAISESWGYSELSVSERTTTVDLSKNSASSRAIPFDSMLRAIQDDPYVPDWTGKKSGMQGETIADHEKRVSARMKWLDALRSASKHAMDLHAIGIHKQDVNRLLEPFAWVTQVMTGDGMGWSNFFSLRCHNDAHPAFRKIARMIYLAKRKSVPRKMISDQEWHLPFVSSEESEQFRWRPEFGGELPILLKRSVARCAWISYENHDSERDDVAVERTYQRLTKSTPIHASPFEHQACPLSGQAVSTSNLRGWLQARKLLRLECVGDYRPSEDEVASWLEEFS